MSVKRVKFKENIERNYYNFSFNENIIKKLYENSDKSLDYKIFKNNIYLKVTRNYLRYRWLIIYLLGCTSVVHETFNYDCVKQLDEISNGSFSNEGALSYRNSECGYKNKIDLFPNYDSVKAVSYTHLTLPTTPLMCRSRWSPYH